MTIIPNRASRSGELNTKNRRWANRPTTAGANAQAVRSEQSLSGRAQSNHQRGPCQGGLSSADRPVSCGEESDSLALLNAQTLLTLPLSISIVISQSLLSHSSLLLFCVGVVWMACDSALGKYTYFLMLVGELYRT